MKKLMRFALYVSAIVLFFACDQNPECSQNVQAGLKFTLGKNPAYTTSMVADSVFDESGVLLTVNYTETKVAVSRPADPVWFHYEASNADTLYASNRSDFSFLPLVSGQMYTSFQINYGAENDKIICYYKEDLEFLDVSCGFVYNYRLDSIKYSNTIIDSIIILSRDANTDVDTENIKIYYH